MDESNAIRVSAHPAEGAERRVRYPARTMVITLVVTTSQSGHHMNGLLFDTVSRRGDIVEAIRVRRGNTLVSSYDRPGVKR